MKTKSLMLAMAAGAAVALTGCGHQAAETAPPAPENPAGSVAPASGGDLTNTPPATNSVTTNAPAGGT